MNRDYEVGYGKPPTATRFQKGQSGNPNGRRRKPALEGRADLTILKLLEQKVRVKRNGVLVSASTKEALEMTRLQQALGGNRLSTNRILDDYAEAVAFAETERAERYAFWTEWRRRYAEAPLNWPLDSRRAPILPHPLDIVIDATSLEVSFCGPLDAEELQLFLAPVLLSELLFIRAEQASRQCSADDGLPDTLHEIATTVFGLAPPSLGGQADAEDMLSVYHRVTASIMEVASMTNRGLEARHAELQTLFDRAVRDSADQRRIAAKRNRKRLAAIAKPRSQDRLQRR